MRMGPYTMDARRYGLAQVLRIQEDVNSAAREQGRPLIDLINEEEHIRILELMAANTWPDGWSGDEVHADVPLPQITRDGKQELLFGLQ